MKKLTMKITTVIYSDSSGDDDNKEAWFLCIRIYSFFTYFTYFEKFIGFTVIVRGFNMAYPHSSPCSLLAVSAPSTKRCLDALFGFNDEPSGSLFLFAM